MIFAARASILAGFADVLSSRQLEKLGRKRALLQDLPEKKID